MTQERDLGPSGWSPYADGGSGDRVGLHTEQVPARKVERNSLQMLAVSVNASVELRLTGPDLSSSAQGLKVLEF